MKMNGCWNRPQPRDRVMVQDGYHHYGDGTGHFELRAPRYVQIVDPMSKDCRYSIDFGNDPRCAGCVWNQFEEKKNGQTSN